MMKEKYESLPLATLKDLAKARGLKGISTMKKAELIERMLEEDEKEKNNADAIKNYELFLKYNKDQSAVEAVQTRIKSLKK